MRPAAARQVPASAPVPDVVIIAAVRAWTSGVGPWRIGQMRALLSLSLVVLLLASGCAGHMSGPEASRGMSPCLPTAVSAQFFFWPVVAFRMVNLLTEGGEAAPAS